MAIKMASEVGSLVIVIKLEKILLSAAILARFCCLAASLKALVLPLLLHMDGGTIGGRYGYRNDQQSWLTCYRHKTRKILLLAAMLA